MRALIALTLFIVMLSAGSGYAQVRQEPPPSAPPVEKISPVLRDLTDATPWELFAGTLFERKKFHNDEFNIDYFVEIPIFSDEIKALDGKTVTVKGYMVTGHSDDYEGANVATIDHMAPVKQFLITGLPAGGCGDYDGPGSLAVEVHPVEAARPSPRVVAYKGTLELVSGSVEAKGIYYRLRDAVPVQK